MNMLITLYSRRRKFDIFRDMFTICLKTYSNSFSKYVCTIRRNAHTMLEDMLIPNSRYVYTGVNKI